VTWLDVFPCFFIAVVSCLLAELKYLLWYRNLSHIEIPRISPKFMKQVTAWHTQDSVEFAVLCSFPLSLIWHINNIYRYLTLRKTDLYLLTERKMKLTLLGQSDSQVKDLKRNKDLLKKESRPQIRRISSRSF
jgi:TRAP-type C4-dicarboxylate transport system permease small subunit